MTQPSPENQPQRGLETRYRVEKISDPTGKHTDCRYFVLDPTHDPIAADALAAYALLARQAGQTQLALDIYRDMLGTRACAKCACTEEYACWPSGCMWVEASDLCSSCLTVDRPPRWRVVSLLQLVSDEYPGEIPTLDEIDAWELTDVLSVVAWATAVHLAASENHDVRVPAVPEVLRERS